MGQICTATQQEGGGLTKSLYTARATLLVELETEAGPAAIADVVQDWRIITWEGSMGLNEAHRRLREVCAE